MVARSFGGFELLAQGLKVVESDSNCGSKIVKSYYRSDG